MLSNWDTDHQVRHAAICSWPKFMGRTIEYLRLRENLNLLGYNGCVESLHADSIIQHWKEAGWIEFSPDGIHIRTTSRGREEDRLWRAGTTNETPMDKRLVAGEPARMKTEGEVLTHVRGLLKDQYRYRDVRNAALSTWRHIIDNKGGKAPQWDFKNSINVMVMKEPGRVLEPVEILVEWQESGWVEYSPDGSKLRITSSGVAKLEEWEEEDRRWRTGEDRKPAPTTIHLRFSDSSLAEQLSKSKPPEGVTVSEPKEVIEASAPAQIFSNVYIQFGMGAAVVGVLAKWIYDAFKELQNKPIQINRKTVVVTEAGLTIFIQEEISIGESLEKQQNEMTTSRQPADLIQSLLDDVSKLPVGDGNKLDALQKRGRLIITKVFSSTSRYRTDLESIKFHAATYQQAVRPGLAEKSWERGREKFKNLCNTMLEDLQLTKSPSMTTSKPASNEIFVVHGHDNEMKLAVARTIEQLGLKPIILHEQPDKGFTVIEKFFNYSDVGFAVVLLSPDDMGYAKTSVPDKARPRARQNVVLELGFFLGKLGRNRVLALHRTVPNFEMPSDYAGVIYKPFDDAGAWRFELAKELNALDYNVDANKLV